jgi:hypothetical protein
LSLPPIAPYDTRHSWLKRNRAWTIPLGCLTLIVLLVAFGFVAMLIVETSFRHSEAYKQGVAKAVHDPRVIEQLGPPVRVGWLAAGQVRVNGSSGYADLRIPMAGSKESGNLYLRAVKTSGQWQFQRLQLFVPDCRNTVDLLESASSQHP